MHSDEAPNRSVAWAKSPKRTGAVGSGWLSLADHSIDVAAAAEVLLTLPTVKERLGALAGRPLSDKDKADAGTEVHSECFQAETTPADPLG